MPLTHVLIIHCHMQITKSFNLTIQIRHSSIDNRGAFLQNGKDKL